MKQVRLGKSSLPVSVVGLGSWPLGGGTDWGPVEEETALAVVGAAQEAGICFIDTAPVYGNGRSETLLGRALKGKRNRVVLASKCGLVKNGSWTDHDLRPESVRTQLEGSLSRLSTDFLDLYFIHYPDPKIPLEEALGVLVRLQEEGKIREIGLCNVTAQQIRQAARVAPVACVQNEYSLLHPSSAESVLPVCREEGIYLMGYGTLGGGFLTGKYQEEPNLHRADARNYFYKVARGAGFEQARLKARRVEQTARRLGVPAAALAAAWALQKADVVLCGARTPQQIKQIARADGVEIPPEEIRFLQGAYEHA